jgi:hypothetical protein
MQRRGMFHFLGLLPVVSTLLKEDIGPIKLKPLKDSLIINIKNTLYVIPSIISIRRDDHIFFLEPVDPEKVSGYTDIISQPIGTRKEKIPKSKYKSLDEFAVWLITLFLRISHLSISRAISAL